MVEVTGVSVESVALVVLEYKLGSASKIAVSTNIYGSSTFFFHSGTQGWFSSKLMDFCFEICLLPYQVLIA